MVLCDLEGLTQETEQPGQGSAWPDGARSAAVPRREGRERRLRERLTRRGMAPAVVLAGQRPLIDRTSVALVQSTVNKALPSGTSRVRALGFDGGGWGGPGRSRYPGRGRR